MVLLVVGASTTAKGVVVLASQYTCSQNPVILPICTSLKLGDNKDVMRTPRGFIYYGVAVYGMEPNSTGLRYKVGYGEPVPVMRTETKQDMKQYIKEQIKRPSMTRY
jgi:hypothetical protein